MEEEEGGIKKLSTIARRVEQRGHDRDNGSLEFVLHTYMLQIMSNTR